MPEIKFHNLEGYEFAPLPVPSAKCLPEWFKKMPQRVDIDPDDERYFPWGTAKLCSPFTDAMIGGYMVRTPWQIHFSTDDSERVTYVWNQPSGVFPARHYEFIGTHHPLQLEGLEVGDVMKWQLPWGVEVPEGYAALFTHPFNRPDLPFFSFSGIVDSGYTSPISIPFIWVAGAGQSGIIDAGMPLAQIIPFKLEEWEHAHDVVSSDEAWASGRQAGAYVTGYRRIFQRRKVWK